MDNLTNNNPVFSEKAILKPKISKNLSSELTTNKIADSKSKLRKLHKYNSPSTDNQKMMKKVYINLQMR